MFELAAMCLAGMIDCAIHTDRPVAPVPQETAAEFYERRYRELHHKCKVEGSVSSPGKRRSHGGAHTLDPSTSYRVVPGLHPYGRLKVRNLDGHTITVRPDLLGRPGVFQTTTGEQ